jgi:23S rRNA (uracil747-C5)-methyltransferase
VRCSYFDAGLCRSCRFMGQPYDAQLAAKQARCEAALPPVAWLPPFAGPEEGFRNKAKMVVAGTVDAPTLGILDADGAGVDLQGCGLYPPALSSAFAPLERFVTRARLEPYDVPSRRGELKYLLLTLSPDGELMLRFVLRSQEAVTRIRKHLPSLLAQEPRLAVVTANVQPEHKQVLEGDLEIPLTDATTLRMHLAGVDLHLRPRSFFQTNTTVADGLYRQARAWVDEVAPARLLDLYCGVGGFALACAAPGRSAVGVEVSEEAVASARQSAAEAGVDARFLAGDATALAEGLLEGGEGDDDQPDLVVVNPPRRGIGERLARLLEGSRVRHVVYSSCNVDSLARDLDAMPSLRPVRARLFDMFPQTDHHEVLVLLERAG